MPDVGFQVIEFDVAGFEELQEFVVTFANDTDGSGAIDRKELKRLMKKLGQALSEAELDAMSMGGPQIMSFGL